MKSTFVRTWVALAVLAGLGAYIYFVERKKPAADAKEKVFGLDDADAAKVVSLTIAHADGETIQIKKDGEEWRMTQPVSVAADSSEVESLLRSLGSAEVDQTVVENPAGLGDFGLDKPRLTLSVVPQGAAAPLSLLLGNKTPDGGGVYAKVPPRARVFTVASYIESSFDKKPFDLRDRSVLHLKRDGVRTIQVDGPEGGYALARDEKGVWRFTRPVATQAGRWAVDGFLGTLEGLRMGSVAAEDAKDLAAFGLAKPARSVSLGLADGSSRRLEIGSSPSEGKVHAREASRSLVAVVPKAIVDDLAKGMGELRSKRVLDFSTYEVAGFDVEAGGVKRVYAKSTAKGDDGLDTSSWKRTAPDAKALETKAVEDALFKLGGTEVAEFIDKPDPAPSAYGLDQPALRVSLRFSAEGKEPREPVWLEVGKKDGAAYGRRSDDEAILKLDPAKADELVGAFEGLS
jgi:Domain of unknown function (DUF4340)